jgi:hypothetical protein
MFAALVACSYELPHEETSVTPNRMQIEPIVWRRLAQLLGAVLLLPLAARAQSPAEGHRAIAEVRVSPEQAQVESGGSLRFSATAYDSSGVALPGVPFLWLVDPDGLGAVDSTGTFTAAEPQQGAIIAVPLLEPEPVLLSEEIPVIGFAQVNVLPAALAELRVEGPSRVMAGSYLPLRAVGKSRHSTVDVKDAEWHSSAPRVAEVEGGYLLARSRGTATLTARKDGVEGKLIVQVTPNRARALRIRCAGCGGAGSGEGKAAPGVGEAAPGAGGSAHDEKDVWPDRLRVPVGEAIRLDASASGVSGPVAARWWLDGEGALMDRGGNFVAEQPGRFVVMAELGHLSSRLIIEAEPRKRRGVFGLVGRGPVANPRMSDLWVFEGLDGRDYAYTGSIGGDQVKVWDVTDPAHPVQTDSLVVDARVVNDVNLNQTRKVGVLTREGASTRKNGVMLFDASVPAHPRIISEYTETVTSGVHNAFFDGDYIYATNDGTRALHILSAKDPTRPVEVARWEVRPGQTNKYLHDVIVQQGLAYLSYWDDGLVILDVGNGVKGGSPEKPAFVSQIAYPEGHTHTAWRWKNYVFTGDEIFGGPPVTPDGGNPGGFVHVIDVSDLERPAEVAKYEVHGAGAHNIWMDEENEILFVSYYNGGVRALDVSGNLRGDLMKQGRELAYFLTGEPDPAKASKANSPMNWGPQLHKGHVFSSDMNSGLWVLRYQSLQEGKASKP